MPVISFDARFADAVACGAKRQTIRPRRKKPVKIGDKLHLFTGLRTKARRRLGLGICVDVQDIRIESDDSVALDGVHLLRDELHGLAQADGFDNTAQFIEWFRSHYGLPWVGQMIQWTLFTFSEIAP